MSNPYDVVRQFEAALCEYTGAPYCVTTTSCTMAILLACSWFLRAEDDRQFLGYQFEIPRFTYIGVPQSIIHAGGRVTFRDEEWSGAYQLKPYPIWDSARWLYRGMYRGTRDHCLNEWDVVTLITLPVDCSGQMLCLSFHHTKHLGVSTHGGAILHDNPEADAWLRRARFDGRTEGVAPKDDKFEHLGWHCYMTPPTAAEGLLRLATLPKHNDPLPWGPGTSSDYPDLSQCPLFK